MLPYSIGYNLSFTGKGEIPKSVYAGQNESGPVKGIEGRMQTRHKTRRFGGFTTAGKLYVGIVLLVIVLVVGWLAPYSMKGRATGNVKWSGEGDQIPLRAIERIANKRFVAWAANPIVVEAVEQANSKGVKPLDEIIELDRKWMEEPGVEEWIKQFVDNPCARYLRQLQAERGGEKGLYAEIFLMDRQGCIVAESEKTSDYWQGDEDKFVKAFADGKGAVFIDEPVYDESTRSPLIQVSLPVIDPNTGKAIGVMTVGLNIGVLEEQI